MNRILIVEDEPRIVMFLEKGLGANGFATTSTADANEVTNLAFTGSFDLILLDLGLPKKDGLTLLSELRGQGLGIPIIILTARDDIHDKVKGLSQGADDYLTKPFSVEELQMRVKALLKRIHIKVDKPEEKIILLGRFTFDIENSILRSKSESKNLTKKEAQILKILYKFKNNVIPREVILNAVWGQDDYFVGRSLDVFISKLRKYLKEESNIHISNIHGIGFKLEIQE